MTVKEYIGQSSKSKFWLCPNLSISGGINIDILYQGYECTKGTVPELIRDKKVLKHFSESGMECIIWENVPYVNGEYKVDMSNQKSRSWASTTASTTETDLRI